MSWNLLGHTWAENLLQKHIANQETRHAYLFTGAPGIGRHSLALAFASALNCTQPPEPAGYCGTCRACRLNAAMQHPDLSILSPQNDSRMIKVDQVRELQHTLSLTPYEARFRIALLPNFQLANANAQNALLKTLEEAPDKVILLLTADSTESLLPTIASRCEIIRLRPVAVEQLEEELVTRWKLAPENARLYAHIANGRPGLALQMAADPQLLEKRKAWLDELLRLLPLDRRGRFAAAEALCRNREQLRLALEMWLSLCRDMLMLTHGMEDKVTNVDYLEDLRRVMDSLAPAEALRVVNRLIKALDELEANANLRLLLENVFLDLPQVS